MAGYCPTVGHSSPTGQKSGRPASNKLCPAISGELYEQTQQWSDAKDLQQALFRPSYIDAEDIAYRWQWQLGRRLELRNIQERSQLH